MTQKEMSVIVCTANRANKLEYLLNNITKQITPFGDLSWELLIVDNNSIDQTKEKVLKWKADKKLPIEYIFEPRQGKSFALNHGINEAKGRLLVFTDDDIIPDDRWLLSLYEAAGQYPHNIIGGKVLPKINGDLPDWLTREKPYSVIAGPLVEHDKGNEIKEYDDAMWVPIGCNVLIKKEMFNKFGLYSTNLGFYSPETMIYGEDSEMMFRFKKAGEKLLYYPEALVYHPADAKRINKTRFRRWYWGSGRGKVRWMDITGNPVRYANIPRYILRDAAMELIRFLVSLASNNKHKKFFYELRLIYWAGMIYEYYVEGN